MDWAASWSDGVDRFDRYSKLQYTEQVSIRAIHKSYTRKEGRSRTALKAPIFTKPYTLVF